MHVLANSNLDSLHNLMIGGERLWFAGGRSEVMAPLLTLLQRQTQLKVLAMADNEGFTDEQGQQISDALDSQCRVITDEDEINSYLVE